MRGGVLLDRKTGKPVVDDRLRIQLADRPEHLERVEKLIGLAIERPGLVATERNPPLYMDVSNAYSGDELGLPNRDMIGEGVVGAGDLKVTGHAAANSVDVAAGSAWVLGDTNAAAQPNYRVYNDAVVNLGISPDPTNPRRVLVGAQITDQGFAGVGRTWALSAIHGTPAGSPVLPATPASFLPLANVLVPAAAASSAVYTITEMRTRARVGAGQAFGFDNVLGFLEGSTTVNATGSGAYVAVLTMPAIVFDGMTRVKFEAGFVQWTASDNSAGIVVDVTEAGAAVASLFSSNGVSGGAAANWPGGTYTHYFTPTAASHTYVLGLRDFGAVTTVHARVLGYCYFQITTA